MSFRLFIYYCTLAGAASALAGWALGRYLTEGEQLIVQGLKGLYLGLALAFGLSLVDALWNFSVPRVLPILGRVLCALVIGGMAGLLGGLVSEALYQQRQLGVFVVAGYTLIGLLLGLSVGMFDLLAGLAFGRDPRGAVRKVKSGLLGGALGGVAGGAISLLLRSWWGDMFADRETDLLWSPSAAAFAALGGCIGLLIGLAQVILKEAWVKVEMGFRPGRELILARAEMTIGRAETADIGLFGDNAVDRLHARIVRQGEEFVVTDAGSSTGTYVNGVRLEGPHRLRSGDIIQIGRSVLRFGERARRGD